jgi:hypothetical protein
LEANLRFLVSFVTQIAMQKHWKVGELMSHQRMMREAVDRGRRQKRLGAAAAQPNVILEFCELN